MASNPMQRKVRNSFLIGMIITLIICIAIGAAFYFLVIEKERKEREEAEAAKGEIKKVYVLKKDIKSGQIITPDLLQTVEIYTTAIPSNHVNQVLLNTMRLQDTNGNPLYVNENGILYMMKENNAEYVSTSNDVLFKDQVKIESDEEGYYRTNRITGEKEYIELVEAPTIAKVDLKKNTILTTGVIGKSDEVVTDNLRYVEYNMITLPLTVDLGTVVDIRLRLPNSQDLIVVSKKEVKNMFGQTVGFNLTEEEILLLNSAIVEAYIMTGSELYLASYVEPGMQDKAQYTYSPTAEVVALIRANENIVELARNTIVSRYDASGDIRIPILNQLNKYTEDERNNNVEAGMQEQIEAARKAREEYLGELEGY